MSAVILLPAIVPTAFALRQTPRIKSMNWHLCSNAGQSFCLSAVSVQLFDTLLEYLLTCKIQWCGARLFNKNWRHSKHGDSEACNVCSMFCRVFPTASTACMTIWWKSNEAAAGKTGKCKTQILLWGNTKHFKKQCRIEEQGSPAKEDSAEHSKTTQKRTQGCGKNKQKFHLSVQVNSICWMQRQYKEAHLQHKSRAEIHIGSNRCMDPVLKNMAEPGQILAQKNHYTTKRGLT